MVRMNGSLQVVDWDTALSTSARVISGGRVVVVVSPNLSNEALFLLDRLVARTNGQGVFRLERGAVVPLPGAPDLALREERAANATGARRLGFTEIAQVTDAIRDGDTLLVVGDSLDGVSSDMLSRAGQLLYVGTTVPALVQAQAAVVLPVTNTWEEEGTFTNIRGRVQRFLQARTAPGVARPTWFVLSDLLGVMGDTGEYHLPSDVFAALSTSHPAFAGLDYDALGLRGLPIVEHTPADAAAVAGASA